MNIIEKNTVNSKICPKEEQEEEIAREEGGGSGGTGGFKTGNGTINLQFVSIVVPFFVSILSNDYGPDSRFHRGKKKHFTSHRERKKKEKKVDRSVSDQKRWTRWFSLEM